MAFLATDLHEPVDQIKSVVIYPSFRPDDGSRQNVGGVFTQITQVSFDPGFFQWCGVALSK